MYVKVQLQILYFLYVGEFNSCRVIKLLVDRFMRVRIGLFVYIGIENYLKIDLVDQLLEELEYFIRFMLRNVQCKLIIEIFNYNIKGEKEMY